MVILKDQQLLNTLGEIAGKLGLHLSSGPYFWASILWPIWARTRPYVEPKEHLNVEVFLETIYTTACAQLLRQRPSCWGFHVAAIGSMKRLNYEQGRMAYLKQKSTKHHDFITVQLSNVLVEE